MRGPLSLSLSIVQCTIRRVGGGSCAFARLSFFCCSLSLSGPLGGELFWSLHGAGRAGLAVFCSVFVLYVQRERERESGREFTGEETGSLRNEIFGVERAYVGLYEDLAEGRGGGSAGKLGEERASRFCLAIRARDRSSLLG